jgi:hypothetical protein
MAAGSVVTDLSSVADDAYLTIQPGASNEWVINNIYYAGAVEVYRYDGTNSILFASDTAAGALIQCNFRCKNGDYIRVKNVSGDAAILGYDGIVTVYSA